MDKIEIPFGVQDSELRGFEYIIPDGFEAEIRGGKVIVRKAESEDEEIRKHIIDLVKDNAKAKSIPCDAEIAYLEKQKDASKAIEAVDRIDKYIDEHVANAHDMKDSNPDKKYYRGWDDALGKMAGILQDVYSEAEQKEQTSDIDKLRRDIYQSGYNDGYQHGKEDAQKEQKPEEWSNFDKGVLNDAINAVDLLGNVRITKNANEAKAFRVAKDWLETLPERFNLQPKQEWSEGDEDKLEQCIRIVSGWERDYDIVKSPYSNFLKSLRPQPHWKPSEEQMEVDLEKFTEKMDDWKARFNRPDDIPIKATMAFTARMFYMYPKAARQWYESLPKATMD